jgi:DNA primase
LNCVKDKCDIMGLRTKMASCIEARQMDMVSYLSSLGYEPARIRNFNYWYLSPLREEKTPSFKINRKLNYWYDHGIGKGGNLIDFGILYHHCTVGEFLQKVVGYFSFHPKPNVSFVKNSEKTESKIEIISERNISSYALERYLLQRRIALDIAKDYCKEITFKINDREYFGIGFKNDAGGYELRNQYYKASTALKDINTCNWSK